MSNGRRGTEDSHDMRQASSWTLLERNSSIWAMVWVGLRDYGKSGTP